MAENSKIEWTHATFNPWRGCTKISPGCANCYAETMSGRNPKTLGVWGPQGKRVVAAEAQWKLPLKWDRAAKEAGERHRVFCASLSDVFEDWQWPMVDSRDRQLVHTPNGWHPCDRESLESASGVTMQDVRQRLFDLIDATPNLDWLLLTKRPENVLKMTYDAWTTKVVGHVSQNEGDGRHWNWPHNVWLGVSVENQQRADERIQHLLRVPAAVRFLSIEPLLGPVDLRQVRAHEGHRDLLFVGDEGGFEYAGTRRNFIDWVIVGGESGHGARPCNAAWIRNIVQQCKEAGVPCFVKQMGAQPRFGEALMPNTDGKYPWNDRKGGDMSEWPADLQVREFPRAK